jgi:hypothetical protein
MVGAVNTTHVPGSETVMRMLQRSFRVQTRYGGGFVQSISGLAGSSARLDWFYYVNGIEAPAGAATTAVHRGDRIWWDLHDWSATDTIPAVVGSFPEPFLHGVGGKRLPTTVECASDVSAACTVVSRSLSRAGIPVASQQLGTGSGTDSLGVVVGTWAELRSSLAGSVMEHGPSASGVYARFSGGGRALQVLDVHGHVVRTLSAGTGLVAATSEHSSKPTWLVTGTDMAGVSAAAAALTEARLRDHFAVVVEGGAGGQGASDLPVPLP